MGFDDAERSEATQTFELTEEDYKDDGLIPLRYVKFQNVQSVTVRDAFLKSYISAVGFGACIKIHWLVHFSSQITIKQQPGAHRS